MWVGCVVSCVSVSWLCGFMCELVVWFHVWGGCVRYINQNIPIDLPLPANSISLLLNGNLTFVYFNMKKIYFILPLRRFRLRCIFIFPPVWGNIKIILKRGKQYLCVKRTQLSPPSICLCFIFSVLFFYLFKSNFLKSWIFVDSCCILKVDFSFQTIRTLSTMRWCFHIWNQV